MVTLAESIQITGRQVAQAEKQLSEQEAQVETAGSQLQTQRIQFLEQTTPRALTLQRQIGFAEAVGVGGVQQAFAETRKIKKAARVETLPKFREARTQVEEAKAQLEGQRARLIPVKTELQKAYAFQRGVKLAEKYGKEQLPYLGLKGEERRGFLTTTLQYEKAVERLEMFEGFKVAGLEPVFQKGKIEGFEDITRGVSIELSQLGTIGTERLAGLERAGIIEFEEISFLEEGLALKPPSPTGGVFLTGREAGLKEGEFAFIPSEREEFFKRPSGKALLDIRFPGVDESSLTPTQQRIRESGRSIKESLLSTGEKVSTFLVDLELGRSTYKLIGGLTSSAQPDREFYGVKRLSREFQTGLISSPFTLASMGVGLLTHPTEEIKEVVGGFMDLPSHFKEDPFGTVGRVSGEFLGQGLMFKGGKFTIKKLKDLKLDSEFKIGKPPKGFKKTPLSSTFPLEFDLRDWNIETTALQRSQLKRFEAARPPEPIEFKIDPELLGKAREKVSEQKALLKSGARIIRLDEFGDFRIVDAPPVKPKKQPLTFDFDPQVLSDFKVGLEGRRARLKSGADIIKLDEFGTPRIVKAPKRQPKRQPLTFELTPEFKSDLGSELSNILARLKSGADLLEIDPTGIQRIKRAPEKRLRKPKRSSVDKPFFSFEKTPEFKSGVGEVKTGGGGQQLLLKPPKQVARPKQRPRVIRIDIITPEVAVTRLDLKGIPRSVGGLGLTEEQLSKFGIKRTARQQRNQLEKTSQKELGLSDSQFELIGDLQSQKMGGFNAFGTQTKLRSKQRKAEKQLFAPLLKQAQPQLGGLQQLEGLQQFEGLKFGIRLLTKQVPRQAQPIIPRLKQPQELIFEVPFLGLRFQQRVSPKKTPIPFLPEPEERKQGYSVFVKSKKKFIKANKVPLRRENALSLGADIVDNSTSRTFKVKKSGKVKKLKRIDPFFSKNRFKFREFKQRGGERARTPDRFIERTNFAIDSEGELAGITAKGLLELRRRKASGIKTKRRKRSTKKKKK